MTNTVATAAASENGTSEQKTSKMMAFPARVLQKIIAERLSGRIIFTDPNDKSVNWQLYVGNGQIHYCGSGVGQQERLNYLCQRYCPNLIGDLAPNQSDYQYLGQLWKQGKLNLPQLRKLLFLFTQEALIQMVSLPQAELKVERALGLEQLVLSVPIKATLSQLRGSIAQWVQIRTYMSSPFQRLSLVDEERLNQEFASHPDHLHLIQRLPELLAPQPLLYDLARQLSLDTIATAELLKPAIRGGAITLSPYARPQADARPVVACIDDSRTIQRNVRLILETSGYKVLELMSPARALTALARQKPSLVLMDITMPEMDGYELCRILRQSDLLKDVPVVMLTGRDGLVDRIRARMVGATDYLTKPFTPQELLCLAERFAHQAVVERN
ncbi:response regulator [Candidatus Synechococcus calcipolaris G9]|uniref:Response regulator n=1 Tax=Candidatus Synechococcus calcipolaris G9 TaxID=1497997 RepID=A0ABT6EVJ0_9SYNE|nr:response regulator [Candidatus Synechococcus calcipolaris]MDG2989821.1 response regulator [Candidatus Synechococcus calcipolaris G9]